MVAARNNAAKKDKEEEGTMQLGQANLGQTSRLQYHKLKRKGSVREV